MYKPSPIHCVLVMIHRAPSTEASPEVTERVAYPESLYFLKDNNFDHFGHFGHFLLFFRVVGLSFFCIHVCCARDLF